VLNENRAFEVHNKLIQIITLFKVRVTSGEPGSVSSERSITTVVTADPNSDTLATILKQANVHWRGKSTFLPCPCIFWCFLSDGDMCATHGPIMSVREAHTASWDNRHVFTKSSVLKASEDGERTLEECCIEDGDTIHVVHPRSMLAF
jgi:hypothetical protein